MQERDEPPIPIQRIVSDKTYNDVLDTIFPRVDDDDDKTDWTLTLRFRPSEGPESQIFIRKTVSRLVVIEYQSLNGVVFNRINTWFTENGREDVPEMSRQISVKRTVLKFGRPDFQRWLAGFFKALRSSSLIAENKSHEFDRTGGWSDWLHGSYFETWFYQYGNEIHFLVIDKETKDRPNGHSPLAIWMNQVKKQVVRARVK
jgi:hypothetical protein